MSNDQTNWPVFITDGMTFEAYLKPIPRLHGGLRFKFRPWLGEERANVCRQVGDTTKGAGYGEKVVAIALAKKILEWDAKNASGQPLEITPDSVLGLQPEISKRLYHIILIGDEAYDAVPSDSSSEQLDDLVEEFDANIFGTTKNEEAEKNLLTV